MGQTKHFHKVSLGPRTTSLQLNMRFLFMVIQLEVIEGPQNMPEIKFPVNPACESHITFIFIKKHHLTDTCCTLAWWSKSITGISVSLAWLWVPLGKHQNCIFLSSSHVTLKIQIGACYARNHRDILPSLLKELVSKEKSLDLVLSSELVMSWD